MNKLKLLLFTLLAVGSILAQDLSKLTPEQLEMYKKYMSGGINTNTAGSVDENAVTKREVIETEKPAAGNTARPNSVFGAQLFSNKNLTFEPNLNIPTPKNYILGANDELIVDISGLYEANYKLLVSADGTIRIPNVGVVKVGGSTIESATRNIKGQISKVYMGVGSGETHVNITLGNIRSIRIIITGEAVHPGTYTLPSLATAFNALYACGGPTQVGSMRNIRVIRQGKSISTIDIYTFLTKGVISGDIVLQDGDVINIVPYGIRAEIGNGVKHTGKFELVKGETLEDLIAYAGGFADNYYTGEMTVLRLTEKEKTVLNVKKELYSSFALRSGDLISISPKYDKFDNRVDIKGSVYRPGAFALETGMTVKQLVAKADGLKEDAYLNVASITRKKDNRIPEIISFNLGDVLSGKAEDILLIKDDVVEIRSLFSFREGEKVSIHGAVRAPGVFELIENITLKDLIYKARGFKEMALTDSIELIRVQKNAENLLRTNLKSTVYKFAMDSNLNFVNGSENMLLENGDQVIVRTISGYEPVRMVRVEGEVLYPGSYNIVNKSEKISDVLQRAGGINRYANSRDAFLIRSERTDQFERKLNKILSDNIKNQLESQASSKVDASTIKSMGLNSPEALANFDSIQSELSGSGIVSEVFNPEGVVGIDLKEILQNPHGKIDLVLEEGDIVYIPREVQTVRVVGQVLFPTLVQYDGQSVKSYINSAGGFSESAQRNKVFVLYANGTAKSTKKFLGFNTYPPVKPGSRIIVPEKPLEIKNRLTAGELVGILTSITSVSALVYSILRSSN